MVEYLEKVIEAHMAEDMQQYAVEICKKSLNISFIEKSTAHYMMKEFDKKYNPKWHCIVGHQFEKYAQAKNFIYFSLQKVVMIEEEYQEIEQTHVLLFKVHYFPLSSWPIVKYE